MQVYLPSRKQTITISELDLTSIQPAGINSADGSKLTVIGKPGTGKCLHPDERIRVFNSTTTVAARDVTVGMHLQGDDVVPRTVTSVCSGSDFMFRIVFSHPEYNFICNSVHILTVYAMTEQKECDIELLTLVNTPRFTDLYSGIVLGETRMHVAIERIEPIGYGAYAGFTLTGNGRFVLASGLLTHNTTLISSLLYAKRATFPYGVVMSGSEEANHFYERIMPSTFIHNELQMSLIESFPNRQKCLRAQGVNPWTILLIDDCTDDVSVFKKPSFQRMYKLGRHWHMLLILSLQYPMDIPPYVRACTDGTFLLRESIPENRKRLFLNYSSAIDTLADFNALMDVLTENYCSMFIRNRSTSNRLEDCIFFYRATPPPLQDVDEIKNREERRGRTWFGSDEFWSYHYSCQRRKDEYLD